MENRPKRRDGGEFMASRTARAASSGAPMDDRFQSPAGGRILVDAESPVPLYYQIEKALESQIDSDVLREGDQLPSEQEQPPWGSGA